MLSHARAAAANDAGRARRGRRGFVLSAFCVVFRPSFRPAGRPLLERGVPRRSAAPLLFLCGLDYVSQSSSFSFFRLTDLRKGRATGERGGERVAGCLHGGMAFRDRRILDGSRARKEVSSAVALACA